MDPPDKKEPAFLQLYAIEPYQAMRDRASNPFFDRAGCRIKIARLLEADIRRIKLLVVEAKHSERTNRKVTGQFHVDHRTVARIYKRWVAENTVKSVCEVAGREKLHFVKKETSFDM